MSCEDELVDVVYDLTIGELYVVFVRDYSNLEEIFPW